MSNSISASETATMLTDGGEIAFLDVREVMAFGTGHPLLATNTPLSGLELGIGSLVPRTGTRIVVTDGGDGKAERAAERLERLGYDNVAVMQGGAPAWEAAGQALFPEIEVPTKGFGAFASRHGRPNFITPRELDEALASDEDWIVLDARPRREYRNGNIPGSIDAPGADLLRWFDDLVPDPDTRVVINCMSATRGILGGLSLAAAAVPNQVRVLFHGTRGWLLDGYELERGADRFPGPASPAAIAKARDRADRIAAEAGIRRIDSETLARWRAEPDRTTYLFDVRTRREYEAGHLAGSVNAPEGAIIMSPDRHFATLNARYVLMDDDTVRATITALWLAQMGWGETVVLVDGLSAGGLETGPAPEPELPASRELARELSAAELDGLRRSRQVAILDTGVSDDYVEAHIPDAVWCGRPALAEYLGRARFDGLTVLTSKTGRRARLAAGDLDRDRRVAVLRGGTDAWRAAGLPIAAGAERLASPRDDHWLASSERPGDTRQNVIDYLDWEVTLLDDIERGGPVPYRNLIWR